MKLEYRRAPVDGTELSATGSVFSYAQERLVGNADFFGCERARDLSKILPLSMRYTHAWQFLDDSEPPLAHARSYDRQKRN
jgi:hypothetical protein